MQRPYAAAAAAGHTSGLFIGRNNNAEDDDDDDDDDDVYGNLYIHTRACLSLEPATARVAIDFN